MSQPWQVIALPQGLCIVSSVNFLYNEDFVFMYTPLTYTKQYYIVHVLNLLLESTVSASWISWASTCWAQSSSSSMSVLQDEGLTPFPFNQCWNMTLQHASGSLGCFFSMMSSCVPLSSKSRRTPRLRQWELSLLMMKTLFPPAVRNTDNLARVRVVSIG